MLLDEFLDRLEGVRPVGSGYQAICPAHEDREPSLSVADGEEGILVKCHAGCNTERVLAAMGLRMGDLFPAREKNEPEAIYSYTDEEGKELFQAVRLSGKKFRQRHFDPFAPSTDGEAWVWNLDGVRRVLYHLPEVLAAEEVFVVEGEKDVESLRALGVVATTNPMGSGSWRDEYAEFLASPRYRFVRVIADKDDAGRKWARAVVKSLEGKVSELRVYEAKTGKDVTDHIEAGHELHELVRVDLSEAHRNYPPMDLFQPVPPVKWVVENVVVGGETTLLIADGGAGKSYVALAMSLAVADGRDFIGCKTTRGKVIYVDEEGSPDLALQRFVQLGATDEQRKNIDYLNFAGVDLVKYPRRLIEDAMIVKPVLIVIDSHAKVTRMNEENSNNEMGRVWDEGFLPLARETGAAVLVIHHTNGFGGARGATQIRNSADQVLTMTKEPDGSQVIYASKPRRMTSRLTFEFKNLGHDRYELQRYAPWEQYGHPINPPEVAYG